MQTVLLNNGIRMPILGFGVYQIDDPAECERSVADALTVGYRSLDTAQAYQNEEAVGRGIQKSGIPREEIFLTTKVWISNSGKEKAAASIDESLRKLQTDYLDLLLIHQPFGDCYGTYRAMEEAYHAGKVRAIGVSNFYPDRLVDLIRFNEIVPAVNQVETHPFCQQQEAQAIMEQYHVQIESWGPFAEGCNHLFENPLLAGIAEKHHKTVAQVVLRFLIQNGVVVIPKSTHRQRMEENFNVFDFVLDAEDIRQIRTLDEKKSAFLSHRDPQTVEFLAGMTL